MQLATRLRTHPLHTLDLHDCGIDLKPGELLTSSLTSAKALYSLDLGGSKLGAEAALKLAKFLVKKGAVIR